MAINCINLRQGVSIVTSSADGILYVLSLVLSIPSTKIKFRGTGLQEPITAFCHTKVDNDKEFIAGFANGELMYYREEETVTQEGVRTLKVYLSTLIDK